MSTLLPPLSALTPENRGPAVIAVSYALIVVTILFSVIRIITTFSLKRKFGWDDALLILAVAIALPQTILTERSATYGLGRHIVRLNSFQLDHYFKFSYSSSLLWLFAQAFAKSSVVHLMHRLSGQKSGVQRLFVLLHGSIALWLVFSLFALAFQCGSIRPWLYTSSRCVGSGAMWYPVIILNTLTDAVLSLVMAPILWRLQMKSSQRMTVIALFAVRLCVCVTAIAQLATLVPALKATDTTRRMVLPVILGQCVMNLSILCAAAPSLHRFLNELHSQGFASAIPTTQYELSQHSGSRSKGWKPSLRKKSNPNMSTTEKSIHNSSETMGSQGRRPVVDFRPDLLDRSQNTITHDPKSGEDGSRTSGDGSEDMIIRQTKAWNVSYDDRVQSMEIQQPPPTHQPHAL